MTLGDKRLSVIICVHNEGGSVAATALEVIATFEGASFLEVIVADDGSTDGSCRPGRLPEGCTLVSLPRRMGKSAALWAGLTVSDGDWLITVDGDGQNDPKDGLMLLEALDGGADLACGRRVRRADRVGRRVQSRVANAARRLVLRDGIRDSGCGLKAMRRAVLQSLVPFDGMHRFIPALAQRDGFRVVEVPVSDRPRTRGRSSYGLRNRLGRTAADLLGVLWLLSRRLDIGSLPRK